MKIAILIPHFNNLEGLLVTLRSINSSRFLNIIIVDDGSRDDQRPDLKQLESHLTQANCHIDFQLLSKNLGVEHALNFGLELIQSKYPETKYIVRIDSGDVCLNNRIDKQITYLDEHPNIYLVGSWVDYYDEEDKKLFTLKFPKDHNKIKRLMMVRVGFIHSAVMFRAEALKTIGMYSSDYQAAEDYAFFFKFVQHFKTANIQEVLTKVEWNQKGISVRRRRIQLKSRIKILMANKQLSFTFVYGIGRLLLMLIIPYTIIAKIKKIIY